MMKAFQSGPSISVYVLLEENLMWFLKRENGFLALRQSGLTNRQLLNNQSMQLNSHIDDHDDGTIRTLPQG
jgi:hypothetical protein